MVLAPVAATANARSRHVRACPGLGLCRYIRQIGVSVRSCSTTRSRSFRRPIIPGKQYMIGAHHVAQLRSDCGSRKIQLLISGTGFQLGFVLLA